MHFNLFYSFFLLVSHILIDFLWYFCTFSCAKFQNWSVPAPKNLLLECLMPRSSDYLCHWRPQGRFQRQPFPCWITYLEDTMGLHLSFNTPSYSVHLTHISHIGLLQYGIQIIHIKKFCRKQLLLAKKIYLYFTLHHVATFYHIMKSKIRRESLNLNLNLNFGADPPPPFWKKFTFWYFCWTLPLAISSLHLTTTVSGLHPCWWRVSYRRRIPFMVFTS